MAKRTKEWRVYKPKKDGNGAATALQLKVTQKDYIDKNDEPKKLRDVQLFWVSTYQTGTDDNGNASFGWQDDDKRVTLKIGEPDIGEILTVFSGQKKQAKLFHQNEKGSTTLSLSVSDNFGYGYNLRVTKKVGNNKPISVLHTISWSEAEILKILLQLAIKQMYQW